ncbi:efflux RND transporter periplasmic adaptor subunit [Tautonia sociabilis]|uniref:Efflux RND transporter periplasmic adaptor subunit n=1 Tax=Tautonia sociabilis TaxID=2080755 RepID=A0A432MDC6_9BACT|nr:efflux RND transporter periplasmic adaptor subunit [Tautonia sociabilis]RUL82076.1 efflux RND transporter periplasmic adaptor subunit [Tautonia sociabilis]
MTKTTLTTLTAALLAALLPASGVGSARAQQASAAPPGTQVQTLVVSGNIEWIERAALAAKREGILAHIEKSIGAEIKKGDLIAYLDATMAELARQKAEMMAKDQSALNMAQAEREVALSNMARAERLFRGPVPDVISREEYELKQAQLKVADARVKEESAKLEQAAQELKMAEEAVLEHNILAPFDGEVLEQVKYPGEAVQAMEPIVQVARTDRVRFYGYVPLEAVYQLRKGMVVDVQPVVEGAQVPIESKRFRGKIVYIGPELAPARGRAEVLVKADIVNNVDKDLRVGHKANMTVYLTEDPNLVPAPPEDMLQLPPEPAPEPPVLGRLAPAPAAPAAPR